MSGNRRRGAWMLMSLPLAFSVDTRVSSRVVMWELQALRFALSLPAIALRAGEPVAFDFVVWRPRLCHCGAQYWFAELCSLPLKPPRNHITSMEEHEQCHYTHMSGRHDHRWLMLQILNREPLRSSWGVRLAIARALARADALSLVLVIGPDLTHGLAQYLVYDRGTRLPVLSWHCLPSPKSHVVE